MNANPSDFPARQEDPLKLLEDAALCVELEDPSLARKLRQQAHWALEWGHRTAEFDRILNVARRTVGLPESDPDDQTARFQNDDGNWVQIWPRRAATTI